MTHPRRCPAEWEPQAATLITWPHHADIWDPDVPLAAVQATHAAIIRHLTHYQPTLVLAVEREKARAACLAAGARPDHLHVHAVPTDDLWIRDYGPLTVYDPPAGALLLDFVYNGWGLKYPAELDNQATRRLAAAGALPARRRSPETLVLEGGSLDSDGQGRLLTTSACLLTPTRNPRLDRPALTAELQRLLGVQTVLWLDHGYLAGDDTDAHVDNLARFAPGGIVLHAACADPGDEHYLELAALGAEVARLPGVRPLPLYLPPPLHAPDGHRLPASYANFLVLNGAVLVPTYGSPAADQAALATIASAFPGRDIVGVDCRTLIHQHGSLHCATMHLPLGALDP